MAGGDHPFSMTRLSFLSIRPLKVAPAGWHLSGQGCHAYDRPRCGLLEALDERPTMLLPACPQVALDLQRANQVTQRAMNTPFGQYEWPQEWRERMSEMVPGVKCSICRYDGARVIFPPSLLSEV